MSPPDARAGLLSLTQSLAVEWLPKVRVNTVTAGMIETELAHLFYGEGEARARVAATVPLGRFGTPRDVAGACLFSPRRWRTTSPAPACSSTAAARSRRSWRR